MNTKKFIRHRLAPATALALTASLALSPALAHAAPVITAETAQRTVDDLIADIDADTRDFLDGAAAAALGPIRASLETSVTEVNREVADDGSVRITWEVDTADLARALGVEASGEDELAMVSLPASVTSSGDVTVRRAVTADSGEKIYREAPVATLDEMRDEAVEASTEAVLVPVQRVHELTSPEAVAAYGDVLAAIHAGGGVESLAPLAKVLGATMGLDAESMVGIDELTYGETRAMVPFLGGLQNLLTGANPMEVLEGDSEANDRVSLMLDVSAGETLEISTVVDADVTAPMVTPVLPQSMLTGAMGTLATAAAEGADSGQDGEMSVSGISHGVPTPSAALAPTYSTAAWSPDSQVTYNQVQAPLDLGELGNLGDMLGGVPGGDILNLMLSLVDLLPVESLLPALESIVGSIAGGDLDGIVEGDIPGGITSAGLLGSLVAVMGEIVGAITGGDIDNLPDVLEALISGNFDKLPPGIRESLEGLFPTNPEDTTKPVEDGTDDPKPGGGTNPGDKVVDKEDAPKDMGDVLTFNEAMETYDLVAAALDERNLSREDAGKVTDSTGSTSNTGNSVNRPASYTNSTPPGSSASSVDHSGSSGSKVVTEEVVEYVDENGNPVDDTGAGENVNYQAEQLPVTGASEWTPAMVALALALMASGGGVLLYRHRLSNSGVLD